MPSFEEFQCLDEDVFNFSTQQAFAVSIKASYENKVLPILKKWMHKEIDKSNVLLFTRDWAKIYDHLLFYDERGQSLFLKKIYNMLGIYQE